MKSRGACAPRKVAMQFYEVIFKKETKSELFISEEMELKCKAVLLDVDWFKELSAFLVSF